MPTGINPLVPITIQAGFGSTPLANPQTWTDISQYVRSINISRGRQHELSTFQPGSCQLVLMNRDRRFDPGNTSGAYYPNLDINKQIQVLATWNHLSAVAGGATMSAGWTAVANCAVSYASGNLVLTSSAAGNFSATTPTGTNGFAVMPGRVYSAIASLKGSAVRATNVAIVFYTSAGSVISTITGSDVNDSTSAFVQASLATATAPANAAFAAVLLTVKSAAGAAETATIQQVGAFPIGSVTTWQAGGPVALFTGFIDTVQPQYPDQMNSDTVISCTDALRLLQSFQVAAIYKYQCVTVDAAQDLWRFDDSSGGTAVNQNASGDGNGTYGSSPTQYTLGQSSLNSIDTAATVLLDTGGGTVSFPLALQLASPCSIELWFKTSVANATLMESYHQLVDTLGIGTLALVSGALVYTVDHSATTLTSPATYNDNNWHHVVITDTGSKYTMYVDGAQVQTGSAGSGINASSSTQYNWGAAYTALVGIGKTPYWTPTGTTMQLANGALYPSALSLSQVASHYAIGKNGFQSELSGSRIRAILAIIGWPSAWQSIDNGDTTLQASGSAGTALSMAQAAELAEHGAFFINASGIVDFVHRTSFLQSPRTVSAGTFGEGAGETPYLRGPTFTLDNHDLYNQARVQRVGGVQQRWDDTTSQAKYGVTTVLEENGLLTNSDADSLARAQWDVAHFAYPTIRVREITVNPNGDPKTRYNQVIFRELMDRITVKRRAYNSSDGSFGTPTFTQDYLIEGMSHVIDFGKRTWKTSYKLSYAETQSYWVLDTSLLDTSSRLAY